jgi:hypothetical protein
VQDEPAAAEILPAVARFLRETVTKDSSAHTMFQARVAANAVDLAAREAALAPKFDEEERARLKSLLGEDGDLQALNCKLADRITGGTLTLDTPGLKAHLWATSMAKLAVDQPAYASYRRALKRRGDL